jgi:hypothetical protein
LSKETIPNIADNRSANIIAPGGEPSMRAARTLMKEETFAGGEGAAP